MISRTHTHTTSHPSLVNRCKPLPGISDHDIVLIDANVRATRTRTPKRKIYLWKTANTHELQDEVRTNMEDFPPMNFLLLMTCEPHLRTFYLEIIFLKYIILQKGR